MWQEGFQGSNTPTGIRKVGANSMGISNRRTWSRSNPSRDPAWQLQLYSCIELEVPPNHGWLDLLMSPLPFRFLVFHAQIQHLTVSMFHKSSPSLWGMGTGKESFNDAQTVCESQHCKLCWRILGSGLSKVCSFRYSLGLMVQDSWSPIVRH